MRIEYEAGEDILFIRFSDKPIVHDVSHGWNVVVGMAQEGIAQITVLDAKKSGFLPMDVVKTILRI